MSGSQQVNWLTVADWVADTLDDAGSWPMAGTPAWCELSDDDPRKLASLLDAARHWALRVDTCQQAACQASHDVSATTTDEDGKKLPTWTAVSTELLGLTTSNRIPREVA